MHERSSRTTFMASIEHRGRDQLQGSKGRIQQRQGSGTLLVGQSTSGNMTLSKYQDWKAWRTMRRLSPARSCCNIQIQFKDWVYRLDVFCSLRASLIDWLTEWMNVGVRWKWKRKWWKWTTAKLLPSPWFPFSTKKNDLNCFELNPNSIFLPAAKFKVFEFNFKTLNLICSKQLYDNTTHIIRINFNKH